MDRRKVQEYAGCPQKDHRWLSVDRRKLAGNSPEEAIDASEQAAEVVLELIVVSMMIKHENGR